MTDLRISGPPVTPDGTTLEKHYAVWVTHPGDTYPQKDWFVIDATNGEIRLDDKVIGCDLALAKIIGACIQDADMEERLRQHISAIYMAAEYMATAGHTEEATMLQLYAGSLYFEGSTFRSTLAREPG